MSTNEVVLSGNACDLGALRFTPAGIPIAEFSLRHASMQLEAGAARQVEVAMPAIVVGELATRITAAPPDKEITARGFLAKRSRNSTQIVLHAIEIEFQET